jgi:hypothetical protein
MGILPKPNALPHGPVATDSGACGPGALVHVPALLEPTPYSVSMLISQ